MAESFTTPLPQPEAPAVKLAARVAHELNNPLDAVLRLVSLAQRKARSGDYADVDRHLSDAQFGLLRMAEILRELMDVGRQAYDLAPRRPIPLAELITQAWRTIQGQAEKKRVTLRIESAVPDMAHNLRLSQVLANLFKNALDAAPENSVLHLNIQLDDETLTLTLLDEGPGVDPAILPRLFTPFATTKPRGQGHGLGLAISREIMSSLGGALTLETTSPQGCRATLSLPIQRAHS